MTNRRFFITASGRMDLGPKMVQPGDEVYIVVASKVPLLLTPLPKRANVNTKCFEHLGDRYVHGNMQGGFMDGRIKERCGLNS